MGQGMQTIFSGIPTGVAVLLLLVTALLSYLLGCLNGAVVVSKYILQNDIRAHGSGNAGLTNFYRTFGGKITFAVIALDLAKMLVAVFISCVVFSIVLPAVPIFVRCWAGLFCTLGHMFPIMFQFRGGKGILSGGALVLTLDWRVALTAWGLFILIVVFTKLVSLGSCCAVITLPLSSTLIYRSPSIFVVTLLICLIVVFQHRGNLGRLANGKESRFDFSRKQVKP